MDEIDILNAVQAEFSFSALFPDAQKALDYYLGNPLGNEQEGRSQVVSTDVADAIEWIMPQIMKALTEQDEVVSFDPLHVGDEKQAALESAYVYDVLMKENNGFTVLSTFVKDALIQRTGQIKIWYEREKETKRERYTGITAEQLAVLMPDDSIEIIEKTDYLMDGPDGSQMTCYDVMLAISYECPKIRMCCVPVEEFRVNNDHNSILLDSARFVSHVRNVTRSWLLEQGFPEDVVEDLPTYTENPSYYRLSAQGEYPLRHQPADPSQEMVSYAECYMHLDINGDGIAEYVLVKTAGGGGITQTSGPSGYIPTTVLEWEELDYKPWVSTTPILMGHKYQGLSIYDRLKSIMEIKTALVRNNLDNTYLINNQRTIVQEGMVNMDDVMVSRPGAPIRVKNMQAIMPLPTVALGGDSYKQIEYWDRVRAGRTGVDPNGEAAPSGIGGTQIGSNGAMQMMTESQELVGLIVRTIAETGIKPLMYKIRDLLTRHVDAIQDYQFRGQWVQVNPATWKPRPNCTVRVGTGSGNRAQKVASLQTIFQLQAQLAASPYAAMALNPTGVFNALDDFCRWSGLGGAERYFTDPTSPQGQQAIQVAQQGQQAQAMQAQQLQALQVQQQVELTKAEAKVADATMLATQSKHQLTLQKQQYDAEIQQLKQQLDEAKAMADANQKDKQLQFQYDKLQVDASLRLTELELQSQQAAQAEQQAAQQIERQAA